MASHPPTHRLSTSPYPSSLHLPIHPPPHGSATACFLLMGVTIIFGEMPLPKKTKSMHHHRDCVQVSSLDLKIKTQRTRQKIHFNVVSITQELEVTAPGTSWSEAPTPCSPWLRSPQKALAAPARTSGAPNSHFPQHPTPFQLLKGIGS